MYLLKRLSNQGSIAVSRILHYALPVAWGGFLSTELINTINVYFKRVK